MPRRDRRTRAKFSASAPRACFQPWTTLPPTSLPGARRAPRRQPASFARARARLSLDVADRQPQQLDDRVVVGEVTTVLDDLAELVVQRLDRVRGVDDLPEIGSELQERDEPFPRGHPGRDRRGLAPADLGVGEGGELGLGGLDGRCRDHRGGDDRWVIAATARRRDGHARPASGVSRIGSVFGSCSRDGWQMNGPDRLPPAAERWRLRAPLDWARWSTGVGRPSQCR